MNRHRFLRLVVFLLLAALPLVAQEQTSSIQGTVTDPSGAVLPGVTVEAKRAAGGATLTTQTDSEGRYRFPSLQPGTYVVTASLQGMESAAARNVDAKLGAAPRVDLQMRLSAVAETISVTAEAPLVDVTSSATTTSLTAETIDRLPKGRDFQSVVGQAPSANVDAKAGGISIDGASGSENRFVLDGVDVTNPQTGVSGKVVITDFIEEVQVKSAGYAAEFGGATGGVINLITKTGSNDFRGSAGAYYTDSSWGGDPVPVLTTNASGTGPDYIVLGGSSFKEEDVTTVEPALSLGGPIVRDRLWFFAAYEPIMTTTDRTVAFNNGTTFAAPVTLSQDFQRDNYAGTISGALGSKFLFKLSGNNSGYTQDDLLPGVSGRGSSNLADYSGRTDELENWTMSGYADFIPSQSWLVSARGGRFYRNFSQSGYPANPRVQFSGGSPRGAFPSLVPVGSPLDRPAGYLTASNSSTAMDEYIRDNGNFDLSWFPQFAGTHRIKGGVQIEKLSNQVSTGEQAPLMRFYWDRVSPFSGSLRGTYGTVRVRTFKTEGAVESDNLGFFLQDSWTTMKDRLTLNIGVRTERERVPSYADPALGLRQYAIEFDYADKVAPRLGFSYDVTGDGRWKAYGSYGRYYDITKLEMPRGSFGGDKWIDWQFGLETIDWLSVKCTGVSNNQANKPTCTGLNLLTSVNLRFPSLDLIEPDLKPMQNEEFSLGLQHELTNTIAVGARLVHKELIRTIEDVGVLVTFPDGSSHEEFFIANPGEGIAKSILGPSFPDFPKPKRVYDALELEATKRFVNQWSLHASYVYSRLKGNYSGLANSDEALATPGSARTSPNVNRFADALYNMFDASGNPVEGNLATDRPHVFKAQVVYAFPFGTSVGANQYVATGTPNSTEYSYHGVPFFAFGRGDMGRSPTLSQTDLYVQHEFRLFSDYRLQLGLNVLNLLDSDTELSYYNVRSSASVNPCQVINADGSATTKAGCDGDTAFFAGFNPANSIPGATAAARTANLDPLYGSALAFQAPREVRFHVKFIF